MYSHKHHVTAVSLSDRIKLPLKQVLCQIGPWCCYPLAHNDTWGLQSTATMVERTNRTNQACQP